MKTNLRKHLVLLMIVCGLLTATGLSATPALAFEDRPDGHITPEEVIYDDVIISAQSVIIDGTVHGDVIISAETVSINGTIHGNLIVNASLVEINGFVAGSVASAGQKAVLNNTVNGSMYFIGAELVLLPKAQINRNLMFAGFRLQTEPGSVIGRDLQGSGYQAVLGGFVRRNVLLDAPATTLSGKIGGDVGLVVGKPSQTPSETLLMQIWANFVDVSPEALPADEGLQVAAEAQIGGTLSYKSEQPQPESILAKPVGGVEYIPASPKPTAGRNANEWWALHRLRELLTLLAFGSLGLWLLPKTVSESSAALQTNPAKSLGWGVLGLLGGYLGLVLLLALAIVLGTLLAIVTLGEMASAVLWVGVSGLALSLSAFTLLVAYGSKVVFAHWLGSAILSRVQPQHAQKRFLALLIGAGLFILLRAIPIVSGITTILVTLLGLGAILRMWRSRQWGANLAA